MDTESEFDDMMTQKNDSTKIEDIIYDLEVKKMNLINEFNYLEADKVQIKIESLQKSKGSKDRKDIEILHYNELKLLEDKFTAEMELVVGEFNKRFQELEKVSKTWEEELDKKIKQDLADLTKSITDQTLNSLRSNKEYMNYVKQEELLVKALKFKEAHIIKVKREKLMKKNEEESKKLELTTTPLQKNRIQFDKLHKKHQNEKDLLTLKLEREKEKIKKEKSSVLEQLHHKFKNRKINMENNYKKEIKLVNLKLKLESSNYKIPRIKNNSAVFSKFSGIDNYTVHNTVNSKINFQPEKINVNLNFPKQSLNKSSKTIEKTNSLNDNNEIELPKQNDDQQLINKNSDNHINEKERNPDEIIQNIEEKTQINADDTEKIIIKN